MTIHLANAPVSYGVFEMTVGSERFLAPAERVLDEVAAAGYAGIDLGPLGYLGEGDALGERLAGRSLALSGAYIELPFHDPSALDEAMPALERTLDVLDLAAGGGNPPPPPTLAAAGSPEHRARPGQAEHDPTIGLDEAGWAELARGLQRVVDRCRSRGHEPAFHHHAATYVEASREVDRLLGMTDVSLCLDTGHLLVGGGDPVAALERWAGRIRHVHLKDADMGLLGQIVDEGASADEIWSRGVFRPLGHGALDVATFLRGLQAMGYDGWIVVEQDVLTGAAARFEQAVADQRANLELLRGLVS
ncbi:MAG TPA: TIM barrel protein [Candidatus Limnocylindrales bacterium]|nr:TIM barrel protein [Candidatus Limnocylindrales bacterium]